MKPTFEQRLAFGTLVAWARVSIDGDMTCRHCSQNPYDGHAKDCIVPEAAAFLGLDNALNFNRRTFVFKRLTPPVPRTKPAKFPPLGEVQQNVLKSLERQDWFEWCGWVWDTDSGTRRILNSLVKRGLVEKIDRPYKDKPTATFPVWRLVGKPK